MIETSIVARLFSFVLGKFLHWYQYSLLFKIATGITGFIMDSWHHSFVYKLLFTNSKSKVYLQESFLGKGIGFLVGKGNAGRLFANTGETSLLVKGIYGIGNNLFSVNIQYYGCGFLLFALTRFIACWGTTGTVDIILLIGAFIMAVLCHMANTSLSYVYGGSGIAKWAGGFFGVQMEANLSQAHPKIFTICLSVGLGILSRFTGLYMVLVLLVGFFGVVLTLYAAEIGLLATVFAIPLLPTKYILGLSALTVVSFLIHYFGTRKYELKFQIMDLWVLLFGLLLLYSVPISYIPRSSATMVGVYLLFIMVYFVVRSIIDTKEKLFALVSLLVCAGVLVALYGMMQKYLGIGLDTESWIDTEMFDGSIRIASTLDNPNVLGEYFLFVIPMAFAMLYYMKDYSYKILALGAMGLMGLTMIMTLSRGAWLGLLVAIMVYTLVKDRRLIWLGIIAVLLAPMLIPQSVLERFLSIGNMEDTSTSYRVAIWMASTSMLKDFWPIGIGLSSNVFIYVFQKYAFSASYALHSHNLFLQLMLDVGIWGFLLFLLMLFMFYKNILSRSSRCGSSFLSSFSAALCAGMAGFLVQSMTDNTWYNYRIVLYFWVALALSVVCGALMEKEANGNG